MFKEFVKSLSTFKVVINHAWLRKKGNFTFSILIGSLPPRRSAIGSHQNAGGPRGAETETDRGGGVAAAGPDLRHEPEGRHDHQGDSHLESFCDQNQPASEAMEETLQRHYYQQNVLCEKLPGNKT